MGQVIAMAEKAEGLPKTVITSIKKARKASKENGHFAIEVGGYKIEIDFNPVRMCTVTKLLVNGDEVDLYDLGTIEDSEPSREYDHGFRQFVPYPIEETYMDKEKYSANAISYIGLVVAEAIGKIPIYYDEIGDIPKNLKKGDIVREFIIKSETGKVELEITRSPTEYCMIDRLLVNNCEINLFSLGTIRDVDADKAKGNGCGHRKFIPHAIPVLVSRNDMLSIEEADAAAQILAKMIDYQNCPGCK